MSNRYNEYTGFIPASNPIDWAKLTGGLVTTIQGIGAAREAEKQLLDKLQYDNSKILQNTELGKSQTLNQLILSGSNQGRESMMEWNRLLKAGQITPLEYKNRINNLMDSWSTFANTAKSYDQQMQEALKRQQEGIGSGLELELNNRLSQLGDLRNKATQVDPNNGNFIIGQLGQDGLFNPSSIMDLRSISQPGNMIDNKVDLSTIVDEKTKGWEDWTIELGNKTITDALQNPAIQRARLDLANGILSNPRATTSILKDNTDGNYDFYYSNDDLNSKLQDRVSKENELNKQLGKPALDGYALDKFIESEKEKFILLAQDDQGVYQPNLTNKQIEDAKQTVLDAIDSRLERKVELDEPDRGGGGGGGGGGRKSEDKSQENAAMIAGYKATLRAWGADPDATISSGSWVKSSSGPDFGGLKQGYTYTPKNGGIEVSKGRDVVFFAKTPKDLSQFVYNVEPAKASLNWEEARKMARSSQSSGSNKGSSGIQW
jgi:hypothetical protein